MKLGFDPAQVEGDRLTTSEGASAIIKLDDGTRMTVRPNSESTAIVVSMQ